MNKYLTKYNIELFEVSKKVDIHKHFLVFLIRKFFWYKFNWSFTRSDFIKTWIDKYQYNKNTIKWIFDKGIKDNKFILKNYIKRWKKYYILRSNKDKNKYNLFIKIDNEILRKISSVNVFYTFCFLVIASKPFKSDKKIKIWELNKIRGRTLNTIWEKFWNFKKDNVLYHINKWKDLFYPYFNIINRYIPFENKKIPISSIYIFDWIMYLNNNLKKWKDIYTSDFNSYIKDMEDIELNKYWIDIKYKGKQRIFSYYFWNNIDLWKHFFDDNWNILYEELYNNYDLIIEKVINKY